ncbi:MAG TPA: ABC transporter ATP-binding protein, partial [Anseongella sp.]|nr:ABC transporter ATP-binding protein [Anseongella sp.]
TSNLSYRYSAKSTAVVDNLSLQVPKKSIYGFLGHNGAGKTTTIRLLLGLLSTGHSIQIFGQDLERHRSAILGRIGALIEHPSLYGNLTAAENLRVVCLYRQLAPAGIPAVLDTVGLARHADRKAKNFSTGMKQRLGLAIALLGNPELIILDEPTNGLDPQGMLEIRELIRRLNQEEGKTIFLSSHLLNEVEKICTHVGIIRQGKMLFQGPVNQLKELHAGRLAVLIETDNNEAAREILGRHGFECRIDKARLLVHIPSRSGIPRLIDLVRNEGIGIFEVKAESKSLEELFFSLHNDQNAAI